MRRPIFPKAMLVGSAGNPAVEVFGYDVWLRDNYLTDLSGAMERIPGKISQALLWKTVRLFKGFYVMIQDNIPISKCTILHDA
ncbi:chitinase 3 [Fusarium agapanthi]|uniref:Chitinase 3 n=1 Tax=Fusarium agapanthi TaxID=1803897 RepID=A0A9P5B9M7_9HYPO|nr:chitinase 3 [Fusarium agapanthi]